MRRKRTVFSEYVYDEDATPAQKWLVSVLNRTGLSGAKLAKKMHISRQVMAYYLNAKSPLSFPVVAAICYATGLDDPEEVWHEISL